MASMIASTSIMLWAIAMLLICASASPANRVVTFNNHCGVDVWIQPITGSVGSCAGGAACPAGSSCNTANSICFFNTPTPSRGNWRVPSGTSSSISFPYFNWNDGDRSSTWNGNFAFCASGTQCTGTAAQCDASGCSSAGPNNLVEFNLLKKFSAGGADFYDISNIFGVNVPVSITATGFAGVSGQPYNCGSPGSHSPIAGLGPSSWVLDPPGPDYQWVTPPSSTPTTCSTGANCPAGQVCGIIYTAQGVIQRVCGVLSGFWTPYRVCADQSSTTVFECNNQDLNNLYQCAGPYADASCYQPSATTSCCGCANWQTVFGTNIVPSSTDTCKNSNPTWVAEVQPTLQWLKQACPSCYTYPYDDKSSTFTCGNTDANGYNNQNYAVDLCPGNSPGNIEFDPSGSPGVDISGGDIAGSNPTSAASPLDCAQDCDKNSACNGWSYAYQAPGCDPNSNEYACWLKSTIGTRTTNNCRESGVKVGDKGIDRPGGDMANMPLNLGPLATAATCDARCIGTAGCVAWGFDTSGTGNCWLKSSVTATTTNSARTSGITGTVGVDHAGNDLAGSPVTLSSTASSTTCANLCASTAGCNGWVFVNPQASCETSNLCWLKSSLGTASTNLCRISGTIAGGSTSSASATASSSSSAASSSSSSSGQSTSGCGSGLSFCPNAGGTGQCFNPSQYTCSTSSPYLCPSTAPHACSGACQAAAC